MWLCAEGVKEEFRELRKSHGFFEICRTPELATEITLQPIRRYTGLLDASIIFSDILVIPQAMGLVVEMHDGAGPVFPEPLVAPQDLDLKRLHDKVDVEKELGYVFDAITMTRKGLKGEVPLIGFCGAPWTLMAYMIGSSKAKPSTKQWIFMYPEESKRLLDRITSVCAEFLVGQIKAGAQVSLIGPNLNLTYQGPSLSKCSTRTQASWPPTTSQPFHFPTSKRLPRPFESNSAPIRLQFPSLQ